MHLYRHLKTHHKLQYNDCMKARKNSAVVAKLNHPTTTWMSIKTSLYSCSLYACSSQRRTEVANTIVFHLAKDKYKINTLSNEGLKKHTGQKIWSTLFI